MTDEVVKIYQTNIHKYKKSLIKLAKDLNQLSVLRLGVFVCSLVTITVLANEKLLVLVLLVAPICMLGFGLLVKRYNSAAYLKQHTTFLKKINENECLKLENKLSGFPTGQEFVNRDHPYTSDLDIFGHHSLYQLLNSTTTESGMALLADWLTGPASSEVILERQQAIKELTPKLDWRQHFQASGMHFNNAKSDYGKLITWVEGPVKLLPRKSEYLTISILLSILSTVALVYFLVHIFSPNPVTFMIPLIIMLLINTFVLIKVHPIAEDIIEHTHHNVSILSRYRSLILKIESENFDQVHLQRLRSTLSHNYSAANEIKNLKQLLDLFQLRGFKRKFSNSFYHIGNLLWLIDIHCIINAEKWKIKNQSNLRNWASTVSEFEVLSSLAGFSYANPSFTFPEISEEPHIISFELLGHPLIQEKNRVCNNFNLTGRGEIAMVTGSNMAGKSTFLRTVGINLALALMGAPCCARFSKVSITDIFTSMRTQDNLEEGISSFYAELQRVEQLLKSIVEGQPILFLLDEMFKGTNSKDRHKGGFSLIKQLGELNAFGIIATHDLELAKLAASHKIAANYSFNSQIRDGEMNFNYKLTKGICTDFNASELMKRSGIKVVNDMD